VVQDSSSKLLSALQHAASQLRVAFCRVGARVRLAMSCASVWCGLIRSHMQLASKTRRMLSGSPSVLASQEYKLMLLARAAPEFSQEYDSDQVVETQGAS